MIHALAALVFLGVVFFVYRGILKNRTNLSLSKKAYPGTLLRGALPCTICIAVCEILFDRFCFQSNGTLSREVLIAFLRAALIEEAFKLVFSLSAIKKHTPASQLETMLLCGLIGAGYGLVEKIAYGGGVILLVNALLPLHIFFQFAMGLFLYKARSAKNGGDMAACRKNRVFAFLVPFLIHGLWDSLLAAIGYLLEDNVGFAVNMIGLLLFAALAAGGIIAEVKIVKQMAAMDHDA